MVGRLVVGRFFGSFTEAAMKFFLLVFALAAVPALLPAQSGEAVWDSEYDRWDVSITLAGGFSYGFSLAAYPGVELIIASVKIDDYLPLDFGVSARSIISAYENPSTTTPAGWRHVGLGVLTTVHLSFNNLQAHSLPFLENFDFYVAAGPVYDIIDYTGSYAVTSIPIPANGFAVATAGGIRYFLLDWLAVNVELFNWSFSPGFTAGLVLNF
jgi:hypothetical protein